MKKTKDKVIVKLALLLLMVLMAQALMRERVEAYNPSGFNYYDQLNTLEKSIYDELRKLSPSDEEIDLSHIFRGTIVRSNADADEKLGNPISNAMAAFISDFPEYFWIHGWNLSSSIYISKPIEELICKFIIRPIYSSNRNQMYNEMMNVINNFKVPAGYSRYEILKYIHDWLANKVAYRTLEEGAPYAHEPYGDLVHGQAVCEGYAEAFKLLCDKYGIPCVIVVGIAPDVNNPNVPAYHMWNYVQMEDGKWYAVDVTWDDQTERATRKIYYDFFLVGSESIPKNFENKVKFSESHIENRDFFEFSKKTFNYPPLSATDYVYNPNSPPHPLPSSTPTATKTPASSASLPKPSPSASKTPGSSPVVSPAPTTVPSSSPDPLSSNFSQQGSLETPQGSADESPSAEVSPSPSPSQEEFSPEDTSIPSMQ